ncbi:MAG: lytic transglycosylase domain-containing protein [Polyangiaceae bacterium]|nr:lytic transglycosylase domain-containing protein [Polyangiaceae bacterium]
MLQNRQQETPAWRIGVIAGAVLVVVLGGLATLIIVLTRRADESERKPVAAITAPTAAGTAPSTSGELPRSRLLTEDETFKAVLAQVHGRGKESAELRALVDEEAALAARASQGRCEGSSATCRQLAQARENALGPADGVRITRRRPSGEQMRASWMVGLKMPAIPIQNDPSVRRWFEYYTEGAVGRELLQAMLFRCGAYRDQIEATLIRHGLPSDLLALVFAESGCEPTAKSPVGAAGLWQLMPATARAYHLRVKEGVVDERRSPPKSTEAAVGYLRDLRDKLINYNRDGVWDLMFASYNMGPFATVARLERAGNDVGFWDLVDAQWIPDETAQYVPTIQAIALILNNLTRLKFTGVQIRSPQLTSDLDVAPGTRLSLVARAAATSVVQLRTLNLDISGDETPDVSRFAVQVPKDVVWQARDTLKELIATRDESDKCVPPTFDWGRQHFSKEMAAACRRRLGATANP